MLWPSRKVQKEVRCRQKSASHVGKDSGLDAIYCIVQRDCWIVAELWVAGSEGARATQSKAEQVLGWHVFYLYIYLEVTR